jgi:large subunit ribosomal protein L21
MYAVIRTGGKQYRVAPDDVIEIERLGAKAGDQVEFSEVLMIAGDGALSFGAPLIAGAMVAAEVTALTRGPKLVIFKKRRRKHFRRKNGHRQDLMEVRITEILTDGRKPARGGRKVPEEAPVAAKGPVAVEEPATAAEAAAPSTSGGENLSLISGVGPKIKQSLNELGYTHFDQIAALTPDQIEAIETALKSKGRVTRDEWIAQARDLMEGKPPRAKVDRAKPAKPQQE